MREVSTSSPSEQFVSVCGFLFVSENLLEDAISGDIVSFGDWSRDSLLSWCSDGSVNWSLVSNLVWNSVDDSSWDLTLDVVWYVNELSSLDLFNVFVFLLFNDLLLDRNLDGSLDLLDNIEFFLFGHSSWNASFDNFRNSIVDSSLNWDINPDWNLVFLDSWNLNINDVSLLLGDYVLYSDVV